MNPLKQVWNERIYQYPLSNNLVMINIYVDEEVNIVSSDPFQIKYCHYRKYY